VLDVAALEHELGAEITGEVRFGNPDRALYASDAGNYRMVPIGVVLPCTEQDVLTAIRICRRHGAPSSERRGHRHSRPNGEFGCIARFLQISEPILELDPFRHRSRVQPGIVLDQLRRAANSYGLTFGPDPATHSRCTLGGMIGNNSCGIHSMMAGETVDNVEELDVLTYDGARLNVKATSERELTDIISAGGRRGEIYRRLRDLRDRHADRIRREFPKIPRRVSGYNLRALLPENGFDIAEALVGSECTCVLVLQATVKLVPNPTAHSLLVLGYRDFLQRGTQSPNLRNSPPSD
jgi:FAD/FMN-containing dehydrogenase